MTYATLQELFADPARWTQCANARDAIGREVSLYKGECFCLIGALYIVYGAKVSEERRSAWEKLMASTEVQSAGSLTAFNDSPRTTHADVLALVTRENI